MSWKQFWKRDDAGAEQPEQDGAPADQEAPRTPPNVRLTTNQRPLPPHLAGARAASGSRPRIDGRERIEQLRRRKEDILFEISQGELAASEENPWRDRMALLTEALTTVEDDLESLKTLPPQPYAPVPATPITNIAVSTAEPPEVAFTIGGQTFRYSEDLDWAERGHSVIRTELIRRAGEPGALVPAGTPDDLKPALAHHLAESLFTFASDLRDRALEDEPAPEHPTLADLARPCPECGGWMEWGGLCQACARRKSDRFRLLGERNELLGKRIAEADDMTRLAERLTVARHRLSDVEAEIAVAERRLAGSEH